MDPEFLRVADRIGERLEVVEGDSVLEIREKAILLESGRELPCDVIVFATGFDISYSALMPQEVLKAIDYNANDHYFPVILYKLVLHPRVNTRNPQFVSLPAVLATGAAGPLDDTRVLGPTAATGPERPARALLYGWNEVLTGVRARGEATDASLGYGGLRGRVGARNRGSARLEDC